jgi:hypothetical protein
VQRAALFSNQTCAIDLHGNRLSAMQAFSEFSQRGPLFGFFDLR